MDQTENTSPLSWSPRKVALATLVVLGIACAFWVVFRFRLVFFSLFIAIVLSTAIEPLIARLARFGIPRAVSIILISLLILLLLVVLVIIVVPIISEEWSAISNMVSSAYGGLEKGMSSSPSLLVRRIAQQLPPSLLAFPPPQPASPPASAQSPDVFHQVLDIGTAILRSLIRIISVLLLTGLWVLEGEIATRTMLLAVPPLRRDAVREFIAELQGKVGAYTRGLALMLLIIGVMASTVYAIIGLPNVLLLGVIAGIMEIVPLVGPALGAIPALLVAASLDPTKVIWVLGAYILIQLVESHFIVPRVMDRTVGVNPVASLLAFAAFGAVFGLIGAILAVPLAAVVQLILNRFVFNVNPVEQAPPMGRNTISSLRYEAQDLVLDVRKQVRGKDAEVTASEDSVEDTMESIATDLDSILAQLEDSGSGKSGAKGKAAV